MTPPVFVPARRREPLPGPEDGRIRSFARRLRTHEERQPPVQHGEGLVAEPAVRLTVKFP